MGFSSLNPFSTCPSSLANFASPSHWPEGVSKFFICDCSSRYSGLAMVKIGSLQRFSGPNIGKNLDGELRSFVSGILPGYVRYSGVLSTTVDPLQQYSFHCSESAAGETDPAAAVLAKLINSKLAASQINAKLLSPPISLRALDSHIRSIKI
ncbi:hypothetical protein HAX54_039203 [Datura stramonium]|uniref:Uncharacterized protein n=1 Tax=Datura stramonium TaxID=4076 RepID=A0ABS8VNA4_DATST|nr:hypothetical protein [Datura stramonium]